MTYTISQFANKVDWIVDTTKPYMIRETQDRMKKAQTFAEKKKKAYKIITNIAD